MKLLVTMLAAALWQASPASAQGKTASVYYFDHDYTIRFELSQVIESIANSSGSIKLNKVDTGITYTNGGKFVIERPEDLTADELARTTDYALERAVDIIEGGHSIVLMPQDLLDTFAPLIEEEMSAYFSVERVPARLLTGTSPAGIKFRALQIPSRAEKRLWEPTLEMRHYAASAGREIVFTGISIPMGLNGLSRKMVEDASDKGSAALLSLGLGGALTGQVLKAGPEKTFSYLSAAGTDIAALDPNDLHNFWQWSKDGSLKISSSAPELICSNVQISDPELAKFIKPYALRKIGGVTVGFISLVPSNSATLADLDGSPISVRDPKEEKALYTLINELRRERKAKAVVAISFLNRDEVGWLMNARGIDALIGPKTWDMESGRKSRVELRKWDKEIHTGPALTVFPDSRGAGVLRLEFGPRADLTALESLPPPEDGREPLYYREQLFMKERIIRHFLGSGDKLLPDLPAAQQHGNWPVYSVPDFFNLSAGLLRRKFGAEISVLKVRAFASATLGDVPTAMAKTWLGPDKPLVLVLAPGRFINGLRAKQVPARNPDQYYSPQDYSGMDYYALSGVDGAGRVAALPVDPSELYLTVMPAELAEGKPFLRRVAPPAGAPKTMHEGIVTALEELRSSSASRTEWETRVAEAVRNRPEPRNLWRINLRSLSMEMVNTEVNGPADYSGVDSRLGAVNQTRMQGSGRLFSEYYSGRFRFDSGISADYGKTVLRPRRQPRLTTESVDQLTLETQLVYRMKNYNGALGPLVIGPYASAAYDTEFSKAEPLPLRKIVRGSGGVKLFEGAVLQELYAGLATEQIYTYSPGRTQYSAEAGFRLYAPLPGTALQLSVDGNYRNFARSRFDTVYDLKERLELNLKVSTRLYGDIMLSPFVNFFLAKGKKLPGSASNLTTGFALESSRLFKIKR
ncbi:MAG: hypothetical protein A2X38_04370 [Elusimicrobia bacterium GWC2_61_25]|nr:MAG: hypothetical protein A2X38_04370 [Elusimicrobia bacterium GWC2_61_25]